MSSDVVRLGDLREAASKYGTLTRTRSQKASAPKTTDIGPAPEGLFIETPHLGLAVTAEGQWRAVVSVDCERFHKQLIELAKRWSDIGGDVLVTLSHEGRRIRLSWSDGAASRAVEVPTS